jgi:xanthosine utilization system XapX-like protein
LKGKRQLKKAVTSILISLIAGILGGFFVGITFRLLGIRESAEVIILIGGIIFFITHELFKE